ncbi:hypothetical protein FG386_002967 [Cryptosporidium ryanae]|uniref:uncharacterized protein n=1 Tax=Cryptosporidium ryanae TaxID=515981 RepID=UPI00351A8DF9|nr:hypothetical protein FG386_002967 [Cryptosporidium ryanae]
MLLKKNLRLLFVLNLVYSLALLAQCQGNKYRVNLDRLTKAYQYQKSEIEIYFTDNIESSENELSQTFNLSSNRLTFMRLGKEEFLCDVGFSPNFIEKPSSLRYKSWEEMDENLKKYIKKSKISWLMERCFNFTKRKDINNNLHLQIDIYEICFGVSIKHKKIITDKETETKIMDGNFRLIGNYLPNEDIFQENGRITQFYRDYLYDFNSNKNLSATINFSCNNTFYGIRRVTEEVRDEIGSIVNVEYQAPSFCIWKVKEEVGIDTVENLGSLLLPLENKCQNYTDSSFWTFELCNFYGVTQFIRESSNKISKSFILGLSQNAYSFFNSTSETEDKLRKTLVSNYILNRTNSEINNSNVPNLNFKLEPRNVDENLGDRYVPNKYVITLTLYNGTICEEIGRKRSIKLVYECPEMFEKHSINYFKIMNIVEKTPCEYEMLIQTSTICSHPLLLPPTNLISDNVKCFPRKSVLDKFSSKQKIYTDETLEAINISEYRDNALEEVPMEYIQLFLDYKMNYPHFSLNTSLKVRRMDSYDPLFNIGELVQHRWWNYYGVVVGWDWKVSAPGNWVDRVYKKYPIESKKKPHYLILIHKSDIFIKNTSPVNPIHSNFTHSYVPEIALHKIDLKDGIKFEHTNIIDNPYTSRYFSNWSESQQRFIPNLNSTLWKTYPSDLQITQKDEL